MWLSMENNSASVCKAIILVLLANIVESIKVHTLTSAGSVSGNKKYLRELNREIEVYLGVKFAVPPVGNLRFKDPIPLPKVDSLGSDEFPPICAQPELKVFKGFKGMAPWPSNSSMDEDCLFLNIWKPSGGSVKKPVIVWIHGGSFYYGGISIPLYDGSYLAAWTDAVVVSIQYRLGALGFLYTGDDFAPGNAGLKDQILALKWVNEHIDKFGGDKERITLIGESAGGASVGLHLLSTETSKLFKRAILLSGTPNCPWVAMGPSEAKEKSLSIAAKLGADVSNYEDVKKHLLNSTWSDVVGESVVDIENLAKQLLRPTVGHLVPENPELSMKYATHLKRKEIMVSWTKDEGSIFVALDLDYLNKSKGPTDTPKLRREDIFDRVAVIFDSVFLAEKLLDFYQESGYLKGLSHMYGDILMSCPIHRFIEGARKSNVTVYHFRYDYRTQNNAWPDWMGIVHTADLEILFGQPIYQDDIYNDHDREMCRKFMNRIKNFIENGNPNSPGEEKWSKNQMFIVGDGNVDNDSRTLDCAKLKTLMSPSVSGINRLELYWFPLVTLLVYCFHLFV